MDILPIRPQVSYLPKSVQTSDVPGGYAVLSHPFIMQLSSSKNSPSFFYERLRNNKFFTGWGY
jgi:hypothetical protein